MNKIALIIAGSSIFIAGYFAGKLSSNNYWHKQNEAQLQQYNQKLAAEIESNSKLSESYNELNSQYLVTLKDKQNAIEQNKDLINRNNRITKQLVQYIQGGTTRSGLQKNNTESAPNPDATIPAADFGVWASGLVTHDQQCVNQLNTLIGMIK